jgi:hypothetical protein
MSSEPRLRASIWRLPTIVAVVFAGRASVVAVHAQSVQPVKDVPPSRSTPIDTSASSEPAINRVIPRYLSTAMPQADAELLRRAYGIEDPSRLYVSDSTDGGTLKYDTQRKTCAGCLVNSYHVGYISVRQPGESWEEVERRVRAAKAKTFTGGPHPSSESLATLDPDVRPLAESMLRDAREAGFKFHIVATYRSPLRQAFLMSKGRGRTHTLTSNHSYGRAIDIVIDNGNRANARTKRDWVAFRKWVTEYPAPAGESFHILGRPDASWDWAHVEVPSRTLGFHSVDEAIARAKACLASDATATCDFQPHLPFDSVVTSIHSPTLPISK